MPARGWTPLVRWTEVTEEGLQGGPVMHDDYDGSDRAIEQLRSMSPQERKRIGLIAQQVLSGSLSQEMLCGRMCDGLELVFQKRI